jgi:hypothetical protein
MRKFIGPCVAASLLLGGAAPDDNKMKILDMQAKRFASMLTIAGEAVACGLRSADWGFFVKTTVWGALDRVADNLWQDDPDRSSRASVKEQVMTAYVDRVESIFAIGQARAPDDCGNANLPDAIGAVDDAVLH